MPISAARFRPAVERRTSTILQDLWSLRKLGMTGHKLTQREIEKVFKTIRESVDRAEASFNPTNPVPRIFSLQDDEGGKASDIITGSAN